MRDLHLPSFFYIACFCLLTMALLNSCAKERLPDYAGPIKKTGKTTHKTENLVIVTLDGFRWQEVFQGADSTLLFNEKYVSKDEDWLKENFWADDENDRRKKLLPFFWNTIAEKGQLYGNRNLDNKANVANPYWKSYPGYNEIFTGYVNTDIDGNRYGLSPDHNILEFFNEQEGFEGKKVAAFTEGSWLHEIFNPERSELYVKSGAHEGNPLIHFTKDSIEDSIKREIDNLDYLKRRDRFKYDQRVYMAAKQHLKKYKPRVLYISLAETDAYAHLKKYDAYLNTAYNTNVMLEDLWNYLQSDKQYKNKTTLFISTDHGRGEGKKWISHGSRIKHSDETWFASIGPDTHPRGEIGADQQFYNQQFARTFAAFLGFVVKGHPLMAKPIKAVNDAE